MKIKFSVIFIILSLGIFYMLSYEKYNKINSFLDKKTEQFSHSYDIVYDQHKELASLIILNILKDKKVIDIYNKISTATNSQKNILREILYNYLALDYNTLRFNNVNVLHFHLPNSESFLRMHKAKKFGDSLVGIRDTVTYVNENKKPIDGFEEGRIYNGYRFVYPIFDENNNHLGSVEVSFGAESFTKKLMKQYKTLSNFITYGGVINKKTWEKEKDKFIRSPYDGFYFNKTVLKELKKRDTKNNRKNKPSRELRDKAVEYIKKNKVVTLYSSNIKQAITFIPVQNPVTNEVVAALTVRSDAKFIANKTKNFYILFTISILLIFMILIYFYKQSKSRLEIEEKEYLLQNILDTTKHLTIITDFEDIGFANKAFLDYLNLKDLDDFHNNYKRFCELLLVRENYLHEGLLNKGENFADLVNNAKEEDRKIILLSPNIELEAFSISMEKIKFKDKIFYLVTLIDITKSEQQMIETEYKAYYDELTQIYNRNKLNEVFDNELKKVKRFNHSLSIAIIDIDHFKNFNDTYGHLIGDEVLILLAKTISEHMRETDTFARWGGEEFVIIFSETNINNAMIAAEHLRKVIERIEHQIAGHITVSFGLTEYKNGDNLKILFKRCDDALYVAKENGRNRIEKK